MAHGELPWPVCGAAEFGSDTPVAILTHLWEKQEIPFPVSGDLTTIQKGNK